MIEFAENNVRKDRVCVIDANSGFRKDLAHALLSKYYVTEYSEQGSALEGLVLNPPSVIILDENVRPRGGLALLREIECVPALQHIPIICTATHLRSTFLGDAMALGVQTTLVKPFRQSELLKAITNEINGKVEKSWLRLDPNQRLALKASLTAFNTVAELIDQGKPLPYEMIRESCEPVVDVVTSGRYTDMLNGVRDHDNYTYVHSLRISIFLSVFGNAIGIRGNDLLTLEAGGLLHDVGKISVPSSILNSEARLSDEEMEIMRSHVTHTGKYLHPSVGIPRGTRIIAEQHHEKLDGTGYPLGLKGKELNELARMATIIDIFGALTDARAYKQAMDAEKALYVMAQMKGQLDQHMLQTFRSVMLDVAKSL